MLRCLKFGSAKPPPSPLIFVWGNGQSLSIGQNATYNGSTTQPYTNVKLFDSSGTYDTTNPFASTLSLIPLTAPMKPKQSTPGLDYPQNIGGESVDIAMANQLTALALADRYSSFRIGSSSTGIGGAAMGVINKGGTGHSYAAGIYEFRAMLNILGLAAAGIMGQPFTHGEADSLNQNASYGSQLLTLATNNETDLVSFGGVRILPSGRFPMLVSQQSSEPGSFLYQDIINSQILTQFLANPNLIVLVGPRYPYPYNSGDLHMSDYRPLGEKYAITLWRLFKGMSWYPLIAIAAGITRSGVNVTVPMNVPYPPMVWDTTQTAPHLTGTPWGPWWAAGKGWEFWDRELVISSCTAPTGPGSGPITLGFTAAHNMNTGDPFMAGNVGGCTNANGTWPTVTRVDSTHISLDGSTMNAAYTAGGVGLSPIGISSVAISGSNLQFVLTRAPVGQGFVSHANMPDYAWGHDAGAGFNNLGSRRGLLRDSDPFTSFGPLASLTRLYNWACHFKAPLP